MKILKIVIAVLVVALIVVVLAAPLGPLPGLLIRGSDAQVPASWGDTSSTHEIKLQIGEGPLGRTVIIWTVQIDGNFHVVGQKGGGWASGIGSGGPVRLNLNGNLYEMTATPVTTGKQDILDAWQEKYAQDYPDMIKEMRAQPDAAASAAVFKLTAR